MDSTLDLLSCSHSRWRVKSTSELVWCRQWSKHCSRLLCCRGNLTLRQNLKFTCELTFQPHEVNSCSFDYQKDIQKDSRHQQLKRTSWDGSGISSGHHLDAFLVMYSGSVELGWNIDPEHSEEIAHSTWLGSRMLCLQPPRPGSPVRVRRWMDGIATMCVCGVMHLHFFFESIEKHRSPHWKKTVCPLGMGTIVFIQAQSITLRCVCVSVSVYVCVWQRLIKTVHQLSSADTCLSKEGRAWQR